MIHGEKILFFVALIILIALLLINPTEGFHMNSAWSINRGNGYGDTYGDGGYGTGYAMWGMWPESIPDEPWKPWMWGRRPKTFVSHFTPVPQIDYNDAAGNDPNGRPVSNLFFSVATTADGKQKLAVNGELVPTLQLDRERLYYVNVYLPNDTLVISDGVNVVGQFTTGIQPLQFSRESPNELSYSLLGNPECRGIIYLNDIKALAGV